MSRSRTIVGTLAVALLALAGCAPDAEPTHSDPSPTAACPEPAHGPTSLSCAEFDPDAAMAENERYRDRRELANDQLTQSREAAETASLALRPFALPDAQVTETAVVTALVASGFARESIQTLVAERADGTAVAFGIAADFGGCVFGEVSAARGLSLDVGGYILDGGCLAMVGH